MMLLHLSISLYVGIIFKIIEVINSYGREYVRNR